jgi:hypothetical protein
MNSFDEAGFQIIEQVVGESNLSHLVKQLDFLHSASLEGPHQKRKAGLRNLLATMPTLRELGSSREVTRLVEPVLGPTFKLVRGIYFDKTRDANWKVAWHQDLTIAVKERVDTEGFTAWSTKEGVVHVQPPLQILQKMLTVRIHLDDTDETNGALRVIPGSHQHGRLNPSEIANWSRQQSSLCCVAAGGVVLMRPLILHSSSAALHPRHRRVVHFEYCSGELPAGLRWCEVESTFNN